jgi:hypothetical protein
MKLAHTRNVGAKMSVAVVTMTRLPSEPVFTAG